MSDSTIKDKVAVVGIGETAYYKRGGAPVSEFRLVLEAIFRAAEDAGIDVRDIDGFASYSNDRNDPPRIAAALGSPDLSFSNMFWGGGGGAAREQWRTPARPSSPVIRSTSSSTAAWPRGNSAGSVRGPRSSGARGPRPTPPRTG